MPTIYLTDREEPIERDNVFVKATGWIEAYDLEESAEQGLGNGFRPKKAGHVHFPPRRVERIKGKATHANNPGSDRVHTV